jgi:hypothetical protein
MGGTSDAKSAIMTQMWLVIIFTVVFLSNLLG